MAIVQVSVFEAVNAITGRYPAFRVKMAAAPGASVDAAVAAATRTALSKLVPAQQAAIEAHYQAALKLIAEGSAKAAGIAAGEQAATAVLASCADDGAQAPNVYRPHTTPGVYVPTVFPAVPHWGKRKPWVLASPHQFRPGPPPSLTSDTWRRDLEEIKAIGGKISTARTPEHTGIAQFWEATAPAVYWPVARSVATAPGRDVSDNARLLAAAGIAMDDALIAVFDAKYTYNLWRPVTAIRNAEGDARDAGWMPFIDTPMHPEYPCAHCIVSASLGAVLAAELGQGPAPSLSSTSSTAGNVTRHLEDRRRLRPRGRGRPHLRRGALPQLDGGRHGDGQEDRGARRAAPAPRDDALTRGPTPRRRRGATPGRLRQQGYGRMRVQSPAFSKAEAAR